MEKERHGRRLGCNRATHAISLIAKHARGHLHLQREGGGERDWQGEKEQERREEGRSAGKRGQGLLMALIVQTKSETIHLHNKRPSRSHSRSRSCPVSQLQLQSNFQVQLQVQVQVQVQLRIGVAQPHPHPRCRRAADYLNSRCGRLMSAKAANVRCSWRRSRRLSLAREVAM